MIRAFIFATFLLISNSVSAEDAQWSSFGTLGITLADSDSYGYRTDISHENGVFSGDIDFRALSLLGGQVEKSFNEEFDFVGQVVLRELNDPIMLDYVSMVFLRYKPSAKWSLKIGRLMPDLFMITEYRNINIAYTWANVPNETYGITPFKYIDGAEIVYSQRVPDGTLNLKFFAGQSQAVATASKLYTEKIKLNDLFGLSLIYDQNNWNLQARYTQAALGDNKSSNIITDQINLIPDFLWPNKTSIINQLSTVDQKAKYLSLSGQKYWQNWLFNFELARISSESNLVTTLNNGYVSAAYQQNEHTYYAVFGKTSSDYYHFNEPGVNTSLFPQLIAAINQTMNFYSSNQQTISLGWRWDINPTIASKLQFNLTDIKAGGATLWLNPDSSTSSETIPSLMYTLSFAL